MFSILGSDVPECRELQKLLEREHLSKDRLFLSLQVNWELYYARVSNNFMIKTINHITIQGWMITELKLTGNPLIIYAIIFGFSQAQGQTFFGSRKYLATACGISVRSVQTILDNLTEKAYLIKGETMKNNVKFCEYFADLEILDEFDVIPNFIGGEGTSLDGKKVHGSGEETSHNNKDIISLKEKNNKKETQIDENFQPDAQLLKWIERKFPKIPKPEISEQTEAFVDYYIGTEEKRKSWRLAWQTWIRNAVAWEKINYSNTGESSPTSDYPDSPPNPDFVKGTQIEKFARNEDGSFNRKKLSTEALLYIKKNMKHLIEKAYSKKINQKEKLNENDCLLLEMDYEEYCVFWDNLEKARGSRK